MFSRESEGPEDVNDASEHPVSMVPREPIAELSTLTREVLDVMASTPTASGTHAIADEMSVVETALRRRGGGGGGGGRLVFSFSFLPVSFSETVGLASGLPLGE